MEKTDLTRIEKIQDKDPLLLNLKCSRALTAMREENYIECARIIKQTGEFLFFQQFMKFISNLGELSRTEQFRIYHVINCAWLLHKDNKDL